MLAVGIPSPASNFMAFDSHGGLPHGGSINHHPFGDHHPPPLTSSSSSPPPPPADPSHTYGPSSSSSSSSTLPPLLQPHILSSSAPTPVPTMPRMSHASSTSPQMVASTSSAAPPAMAASPPPALDPPFRGYIDTTLDALLVLEAARRGMIPRVTRRLIERERGMIQSGSVFVFDEHESGIKRWTDGLIWSPSRILNNFLVYRQQDKRQGTASASNSERRQSLQQQQQQQQQEQQLRMQQQQQQFVQYGYDDYGAPLPYSSAAAGGAPSSHRPQLSAASVSGLDVLTRPRSASESVRKSVSSGSSSTSFANEGLVKKTMSVNINGFAQHLISYYKVADVEAGRLRRPSNIPELAGLEISQEYLRKQNFRFPPLIEVGPDGIERYKGESADPITQGSSQQQAPAGLVSPGMYSRPSTSTSSGSIMTPITPVAYYGPPPGSSGSSVGYDMTPQQQQQIHYAPPMAELPPMKPSYGKQPSSSSGGGPAMVRQASDSGTRDLRRSSRRYDPIGYGGPPMPLGASSSTSSSVSYSGYAPNSSVPTTPVVPDYPHMSHSYRAVGHPAPQYLPMSIDTGMAASYPTASGYASPAESFASPPNGPASGFASSQISSTPQFLGQDFDAVDGSKSISNLSLSSPYPGLDLQLYGQQQQQQQQPAPPPTAPGGPPSASWIDSQQDAQQQSRSIRPHTAVPLSIDSGGSGSSRQSQSYHMHPNSGGPVGDGYHSAYDGSMQAQQQQAAIMHTMPLSRPMASSQSQPGSVRTSPQQPMYDHHQQHHDRHYELGPGSEGTHAMPIPNASSSPSAADPQHHAMMQQPQPLQMMHHQSQQQQQSIDPYFDPTLVERPQQHSY